ncbi:hypothetical protein C8A03DRAFT_14464 [Achaetomium macrosporum]|uniref:Uncharacterized protein n=1 Tax=Achaetomium macrosporum TaxID=79813 RepID=A0AAN7CDS8_9PEZI|nr:hypothetical protein C8A03DRAFT_14464 [Achaetomium macrosporum]
MADRHAPSSRLYTSGVSMARSGVTSTTQSVRRNLFQTQQLTRRPPANASTPSDALHLDDDAQKEHQHRGQFQSHEGHFTEDDIVVRDHNGEIELDDPPTPVDETVDMEALNAQYENEKERKRLAEAVKQHQIGQHSVPAHPEGKESSSFPSCSTTSSKCSGGHIPCVLRLAKTRYFASTTELLEAVKASLRAKVAALDEDNWLYERQEPPAQ